MSVARASIRTLEEPMMFTGGELVRGAWYTWAIFNGLLLVAVELWLLIGYGLDDPSRFFGDVLFIAGFYAVFGGAISVAGVVIGGLLVYPIGLMLRRVGSLRLHAFVYTLLAILTGTGTTLLVDVMFPHFGPIPLLAGIAAAVAVVAGWALTARRALRHDRESADDIRRRAQRSADQDAIFEDRTLDG